MNTQRLSTNRRVSTLQNNNDSPVAYEVPSLGTLEILDCLAELNIRIKEEDLLQPTKERVCALYAVILELVFSWENLITLDSDDFQGQLSGTLIWEGMHNILSILGYRELQVRDVIKPTPASVAKVLSVVINYVKICDPNWQHFETKAAKEENILLETEKVQDAIDEANRNYEISWQALNQVSPSLEELEEHIEQCRHSIDEDIKLVQQYKAEADQLKVLRSVKRQILKTHEFTAMELNNEFSALKARAEMDFTEMQQKMKETEDLIEQNKAAIASIKQKNEDMEKLLETESTVFDTVSKLVKMRKELKEQTMILEEWQIKVNDIEQVIAKSGAGDLAAFKTRIQQKIKGIVAKITHLKNMQDKKREAMNFYMTRLPEKDMKMEQEVEQVRKEASDYAAKALELEQEVEQCLQDLEDYKEASVVNMRRVANIIASHQAYLDEMDPTL
ncbi:hypothetical protein BC941DRAFT_466427 [Chlamydoabsidia padenii]|nr:hypothetical protein BC941DRAFT_466427 [Chlamydoabsidia padenii]